MMKPPFAVLLSHYPDRMDYPRGKLLELLGWDDLLNNSAYTNTCAMRMSYALARSGVRLLGARMVGKGQVKGWPIEPGQNDLSKILRRMWGEPEKFKEKTAAWDGTHGRRGVVSFFHIDPNSPFGQGHIDLLSPSTRGQMQCRMDCYFQAREVWFWPLL